MINRRVPRLPTLWYEDRRGRRWENPLPKKLIGEVLENTPPKGFVYQHSRFPLELHETVLRCYRHRSERVCTGTSSYTAALVLAMTRPTQTEVLSQVSRYGRPAPTYDLAQAILTASSACERCLNVLLHRHGVATGGRHEGYPPDSEQAGKSGTLCELCDPTGRERRQRDRELARENPDLKLVKTKKEKCK